MAQYEGTITELSQDVSGLTRDVQRLREDNSAAESSLEALRGELEAQQVRLAACSLPENLVPQQHVLSAWLAPEC